MIEMKMIRKRAISKGKAQHERSKGRERYLDPVPKDGLAACSRKLNCGNNLKLFATTPHYIMSSLLLFFRKKRP